VTGFCQHGDELSGSILTVDILSRWITVTCSRNTVCRLVIIEC